MAEPGWAPVTLVTGTEELLVQRAVQSVVRAARASRTPSGTGGGEIEVHELLAGSTPAGVLAGVLAPSLFEERKVVVVPNLQEAGEDFAGELSAYLAAPLDEVALVLLHSGKQGGGQKIKRVLEAARAAGAVQVACPEVKTRRDRLRFLQEEMRAFDRRASEEALETLLEAVGGDLRALAGACSQLAADTSGTIDAQVVRRYYAGMAEVSGFAVADQALEGRTAAALERLRWALQSGTDPVPIVAALASGLRSIVRVAAQPRGASSADVARALGMPPWKVDAVRRQVRGWSAPAAAAALTAVAEADAQVKGAGSDPVYALETAIVAITRARARG